MSELFSTTPPTEMAIYWLQDESGEEAIHFRMVDVDGDIDWWGFGLPATDQDLIEDGFKFGPKVPSAKELAELRDKAKKWDDIEATISDFRIPPEHAKRLAAMPKVDRIDAEWPVSSITNVTGTMNETDTKPDGSCE